MIMEQYRLRSVIDRVVDYRGVTPTKLGFEWNEGKSGIPAVSALNIKSNQLVKRDEMNYISDALYAAWMRQEVIPGDLLLTSEAPLGEMYIVQDGDKLCLSQRVFGLRTKKDVVDPKFLYYSLCSEQGQYRLYRRSSGSTAKGIRATELMQVEISLPELAEQKNLSRFLDDKTNTIDKMIAAKNHTHTQLSELRQAIITSAILGRGGAIMSLRDTNIPWIGKIPAHWQVEKIKGLADIVLGKMLQSTEKEGYLLKPYLRAQNIRWENVDVSDVNEMWFSPNEISRYRLKKDDILVSEGGEVGRAAMWRDDLAECYIQNSVNRLRVKKEKILPEYLLYVLESYGQAKVFENTVNRVSIAHLTREKLKEYAIPLPPLEEQREIVDNIQRRLRKIDDADATLQNSINQLEEYLSSLISNVVGGKVKV